VTEVEKVASQKVVPPKKVSFPQRLVQKFKRRSTDQIIVSLDGKWLKLVHATGRPQARKIRLLKAYDVETLELSPVSASLIEKIGADLGPDPGSVLIANPSLFTSFRVSCLPSSDPSEIEEMVRLEAERATPHLKEEILTAFKVIHRDSSGYSYVLIAISHQDIILKAVRLAESLDWKVDRVGGDLEGLVSWLRIALGGKSSNASSDAVLLADVDRDSTSIVVLHNDQPYFHRTIACGMANLTADPEGATAIFLGEFQRSLQAFESERQNALTGLHFVLSEVVLTGLAQQVPGLEESVRQRLNLSTQVIPTLSGVPLLGAAALEQEAPKAVSFTALIGLALRPSELDLTPPALKLSKRFEARARVLVKLGGQVLILLLLLTCLAVQGMYESQRTYKGLLRESQEMAGDVEALSTSLDKIRVVKGRLQKRGDLLEVAAQLSLLLPIGTKLDSLVFNAGQSVVFKGTSLELPKVYELEVALGKLPLFTQVEARRVSKKKEEGQDITDFEIVGLLALEGG